MQGNPELNVMDVQPNTEGYVLLRPGGRCPRSIYRKPYERPKAWSGLDGGTSRDVREVDVSTKDHVDSYTSTPMWRFCDPARILGLECVCGTPDRVLETSWTLFYVPK